MNKIKLLFLVIIGNILEYYDFLLFAHIGYFIVPRFIPDHYAQQSHLFALVMFALPFVIRPIGGYFFGKLADTTSTNIALDRTLFYAGVASILIAILPTYHYIGAAAIIAFIILRSLQGFALGGEYTTAGTLLMDIFSQNRALVSSVLGASGTIGSLVAFAFSSVYFQFFKQTDVWRLFFLIGGIATYYSAYRRKCSLTTPPKRSLSQANHLDGIVRSAIYKTLALGAITSVSCFVPMVYSNFYFTKILGMSHKTGLMATLISLVTYVIFTPCVGYISDRIGAYKHIASRFIIAIPFVLLGFHLISKKMLIGQVPLTLAASIAGANIHVVMNQMFPLHRRSRNVNLYFSTGAALGGLLPSISGYISEHYGFLHTPVFATCALLMINAYLFMNVEKSIFMQKAL